MDDFIQKYNIHESWLPLFNNFPNIEEIYFTNEIIYPKKEYVYRVFSLSVYEIKIVLLGQDPYYNEGQADGLSFSVPDNVKIPPSLKNIFIEIINEFPERNYSFTTGNLERWFTEEHIFLLNSSLTVVKNKPGSHIHIWKEFTNKIIEFISKNNNKCVFLLFGNYAKDKIKYIQNNNRIIYCVHPSPLSANKGFFHSGIFRKVEKLLNKKINWSVI